MSILRRRFSVIAGLASAMLGASLLVALPASAAAAYNGACGSGYSVVNSARVNGYAATVYLTYNASTKKNCVVTIRDTSGAAKTMWAGIERTDDVLSYVVDMGEYTSYAGPVYLSAGGSCVTWRGGVLHNNLAYDVIVTGTNCG
ncbi:spore-associated protein A [Streptomyces sp. NPDC058280]|uniref:spore-associated protein A n=1 Tax=Streptomyces sp. NPDC058280 TaxID=3346419 RepID=UPI0036EBC843